MLYFRFPYDDQFYTTDENSSEKKVTFHSFSGNKKQIFRGNIVPISGSEIPVFTTKNLEKDKPKNEALSEKKYNETVSEIIDFIKQNDLQKLVFARQKEINFQDFGNKTLHLTQTFLNLSNQFENAFCYFFIENRTCWMGAFSELLGKFNKKNSDFETMSLAGTLPLEEHWSEKEILEQKSVTDFIKKNLENYAQEVKVSETYDHISGNIKHLRTDFKAKIQKENLADLINELHPTPAVCGIPKDFCKNAIENFEKFDRKFYAGYIEVETEENIQFFVNLRCAEFFQKSANIFVGGGITTKSNPEKEWRETELKAQAILKNIAI